MFEINTGSLIDVFLLTKGEIARISARSDSNGIIGFYNTDDIQQARHFENFISVNFFGADGGVFYHPYKASVEMKVHTLKLKKREFNFAIGNFIACALKLSLYGFGYGRQLSSSKLKESDIKIQLPTDKEEIDFDFMEKFIAELEAERIAELEAYLSVTGLKDYVLTTEEQKALDDFNNIMFEEHNIIDLFTIKNSGNILSREIKENSGQTPYLCASSENNAVSSYISYDDKYLDKGNCIFIGGKTFVVTYQEKDFYSNDSHNLVLYIKDNKEQSKSNQLYLATCINKSLKHKYSWGDSISNKKIQHDKISLPTINHQPNYKIMETLISAVQKLVIKDVVLYVDNKINATKTIVEDNKA